jgi:hypothetical protein
MEWDISLEIYEGISACVLMSYIQITRHNYKPIILLKSMFT